MFIKLVWKFWRQGKFWTPAYRDRTTYKYEPTEFGSVTHNAPYLIISCMDHIIPWITGTLYWSLLQWRISLKKPHLIISLRIPLLLLLLTRNYNHKFFFSLTLSMWTQWLLKEMFCEVRLRDEFPFTETHELAQQIDLLTSEWLHISSVGKSTTLA